MSAIFATRATSLISHAMRTPIVQEHFSPLQRLRNSSLLHPTIPVRFYSPVPVGDLPSEGAVSSVYAKTLQDISYLRALRRDYEDSMTRPSEFFYYDPHETRAIAEDRIRDIDKQMERFLRDLENLKGR